ncbi:MAG: protein kinase [Bacteroidota bacterium]
MGVKKDHTTEVLYPGKKIAGKYSLQARLGRSNIADVWLAEKDKKIWAVKLYLLPQSLSEERWEAMQAVLDNLPQFPSPLLQRPVEYGMIDGLPYVILPYCQYGSAQQWAGKLSESELATFMYQGAKALKMLHEAQPPILHRNLHLFNFLIDQDLNYVLSDVELSGALRNICEEEEEGFIHKAYQAPETFQEGTYGPEADIFSFGMCMFQMATGRTAFGPQGGQRLLHWVQTPKLPDYFSDRFNQIIQVCIGRVPSGRPSADILVRLAERYLADEEWKSIPGFSFGVGRSAKKKNPILSRLKPRKSKREKARPKTKKATKQTVNPYSANKKSFNISAKWLIPASIAFGIGITLYFINPLLNINNKPAVAEQNEVSSQGPIFAPTPSAEPIEQKEIVAVPDSNSASQVGLTAQAAIPEEVITDPLPEKVPAVEAKEETVKPPALTPRPPKAETQPQVAETIVEPNPERPKPASFRIKSRELRDLKALISSTNQLESQLSDLAFKGDSISKNDQAYLQQINSELNLLSKQVEGRVVFDQNGSILGWKKDLNNAIWLKQMNASVQQHKGNLKRIQESIR